MKCTDCIHYEVCFGAFGDCLYKICDNFEDKFLYLKLPCPLGSTVYMVVSGYDNYDDILFKKIIQVPFRLEDLKNINKRIFLTREEAEKKLEEIK